MPVLLYSEQELALKSHEYACTAPAESGRLLSGNLLLDNKNNVTCKSHFYTHQSVQIKKDFHQSINRHTCCMCLCQSFWKLLLRY